MISLRHLVSTTKRLNRLWEKFLFASRRNETSRCLDHGKTKAPVKRTWIPQLEVPRIMIKLLMVLTSVELEAKVSRVWKLCPFNLRKSGTGRCTRGERTHAPIERIWVPQLATPRIMNRLLVILMSFVLPAQALPCTEGDSRVHKLASLSSFLAPPSSTFAISRAKDRCILFPAWHPHRHFNRRGQVHRGRGVEPPPTKPTTNTAIVDTHKDRPSCERILEGRYPGANAHTGSVGQGVPRSAAVEAYLERKRAEQRATGGQGRDFCTRCSRPQKVCLCSVLPTEAIATSTRFIILQHPTESKRQVTGTVPLVLLCLSNCRRIIMPHNGDDQFDDDSLRNLLGITEGSDDSSARAKPLLLFPCPKAEFLEDIALERCEQATAAEAPAAGSRDRPPVVVGEHHEKPPPAVIVIIDGTWSQARQILSRYPSLSPRRPSAMGPGARGVRSPVEFSAEPERDRELTEEEAQEALCRAVMFRSAGPSGYGFRREPSRECISTLESVAYSLEVLEQTPEGLSAAGYLRRSFSEMVSIQLKARSCPSPPRFERRKSKRRAHQSSTDAFESLS